MEECTPQQLKQWICELFDPNTSKEDLCRNVMTLAHIRQMEALRALEEFQKSSRVEEVEWIDCAIEECIFGLLSPENEQEKKDYTRVELWQHYEDELIELEGKLEAARTMKYQLQIEKEFLESLVDKAPKGEPQLAVNLRLSGIDHRIAMEANKIYNLQLEIEGQQFLVEQIEKAVESPLYRKYGKKHIGVDIHRDCEAWMDDGEPLPF